MKTEVFHPGLDFQFSLLLFDDLKETSGHISIT
jgi:hypothetical protein